MQISRIWLRLQAAAVERQTTSDVQGVLAMSEPEFDPCSLIQKNHSVLQMHANHVRLSFNSYLSCFVTGY